MRHEPDFFVRDAEMRVTGCPHKSGTARPVGALPILALHRKGALTGGNVRSMLVIAG